uniref:asparagine synthase (glutamine-hydrolyzing) n=1 Tax=viral metagenome TaxID=1070528 RepID=A0A6C0IAW0_9ZZZZ
MCGIFAYIGNSIDHDRIKESFDQIKSRGPDHSALIKINNIHFGFHRLSINDLSPLGNQPLSLDNLTLICNGEIYNYHQLKSEFNFQTSSQSDCEIILHLYKHFNGDISKIVNNLDGEYSFIIHDSVNNEIYVARDPFGVRPLFFGSNDSGEYFFCSELKGLYKICDNVQQFPSGAWLKYSNKELVKWFDKNFVVDNSIILEQEIYPKIRDLFYKAVNKRLMSDRPVCCLLSGGLDSSLVASIVAKQFPRGHIHTFSIGMEDSPDLFYAKKVADFIGSTHHELVLTEQEFLDAIPETIKVIESYDTTTVRASVGNYLISKYIAQTTDFKVVFNGDGSDEFGSYLYFGKAPTSVEFHKEANRLLDEIMYFDLLRSDRSISGNGLEARVPFLDIEFARYFASIPPIFKMHSRMEKYILRKAFEPESLLPREVLWRSKMAFSDGISQKSKSWHTIINNYVDSIIPNDIDNNFDHCKPVLKESYYYRTIFESIYGPQHSKVIPHFWLPRWCGNIVDPSARCLEESLDRPIN